MKVTERTLVELCRRVNSEQLKHWNFGLKVERRGDEYFVMRLFRKPQKGRPGYLDLIKGLPGRSRPLSMDLPTLPTLQIAALLADITH